MEFHSHGLFLKVGLQTLSERRECLDFSHDKKPSNVGRKTENFGVGVGAFHAKEETWMLDNYDCAKNVIITSKNH
jgi:hypothetical protein